MAGGATRLRLRVVPGSRRPGIVGRHGDAWKLRVAVAPERGRANEAAVELLAETLGIPPGDVTLVSGKSDYAAAAEAVARDSSLTRRENSS